MNRYRLLDKISDPGDLRQLPEDSIPELASEIRHYLVSSVSKTGGHLASNLGVVELTLAIHRVFKSPHDHIIFDVGHQAYVHKLLTGRRDAFETLRRPGGLSGFTKRSESEHDPFGAGHSSTSLSAALGFAAADLLNGSDAYTVAVIGDGAYTGGMIHEALNNCKKNMRLIIIINENEMSISRNIGGFAKQIARIRSNKSYYRVKDATRSAIRHIPLIGGAAFSLARDTKQTIKNMMYDSNYFEELGLYYMGPVNGNDFYAVEDMLNVAKGMSCSCVIHVTTRKGKGYRPAEANPDTYHAVLPEGQKPKSDNFSHIMGEYLTEKAYICPDICAITAAMAQGTGLVPFKDSHPYRFFDVGIAEEHAVTFAAGLAADGMRPFFAVYSSFLQRAYDNIIHDVALQRLPVTLLIDRAGLSCGDGPTHHGIYDVAFLSQIPYLRILAPLTRETLRRDIDYAYESTEPTAVRYANEEENPVIKDAFYPDGIPDEPGAVRNYNDGEPPECVIVTYGRIAAEALEAQALLTARGVTCGTILLELIKPYERTVENIKMLLPPGGAKLVFLEEGVRNGGASMIIADLLKRDPATKNIDTRILAIDNTFSCGEPGRTPYQACKIASEDAAAAYLSMTETNK